MDCEKPTAKEEKGYDPFAHREVEKPNSDIRSTANIIKASLGSGLLAVPLAFSNSGWAVGIVGTLIIGFICSHCVHILVQTSRECCKDEQKPLLGYSDTCRAAFANGPKGARPYAMTAKFCTEMALFLTHVGICSVYTVLIADSLKQLMDKFYPETILTIEIHCVILLVPLIILTQIRHLKWLAVLSFLANILLVGTFAICLYYIFNEPIQMSGKKAVNDISRLPAFLSTVIFAMEGIGIVMPVENTMKKPSHFLGCPSVLVVAMSFIIALYSTLGLFGYLRFGDVLKGSITLNLPINEWPAITAKFFIAISILLTFPLQYYVIIDIFNRYSAPYIKDERKSIVEIIVRVIGVLCSVGIAIALPMLEQIINIVGALFYSILGLMVPCIIHTVYRWDKLSWVSWVLWKNVVIVLFGLICLVSGCSLAIIDIVRISNSSTE